jgi:hypothetical protein
MAWRVFFIGPMSEPFAEHIRKLQDYLVEHLKDRYGYATVSAAAGTVLKNAVGDTIHVLTPDRPSSLADIPTNVFHEIDSADLVIADLSGNRPAVVYELAMAHALGVETILVGGRETQTFYFSQIRFHEVNFELEPVSSKTLRQAIDLWMTTRLKLRVAENPFQNFYRAPLLDISAASGLATGFYDNFARPILVHGKIVERRLTRRWLGWGPRRNDESTRDLKGLIVLHPEELTAEIPNVETNLERVLNEEFPGEVLRGRPNHLFIRVTPESSKGSKDKQTNEESRIPFFLVKDYVIDIPRTMFSLKLSHRLRRLSKWRDRETLLDQNMQDVLIECFFDNLKELIRLDRTIQERGIGFHIGKAEELGEIIRTGKSRTFPSLRGN